MLPRMQKCSRDDEEVYNAKMIGARCKSIAQKDEKRKKCMESFS
jgi:hypothetical protein